MRQDTKEFMKWFFKVDWSDMTNYIALLLALLLFWWGIKTMISVFVTPVP